MADETEGKESGGGVLGAATDASAVALALGGASRERADSFLKKQEALIDGQRRHLHKQLLPRFTEKWLGARR